MQAEAKSLTVPAKVEELERVTKFLDDILEKSGCPPDIQMLIDLAAEEVYVNIACYAYGGAPGEVIISCEAARSPGRITVCFCDRGTPYNPLIRKGPDLSLSAEKRGVGGLGVFLVKNTMEEVSYQHMDGRNVLTIKKRW